MSKRPSLSKPELKKMFLRVLYECLYGKMQSHSPGIDSVVPSWMNEYFKMELYPEEIQLTHEAIQELKSSGLIVQDPSQYSDVFQTLTQKGKDIVEKQQDPDVYAVRLEQVLKNRELLSRCLDLFNEEEYESAIFSAFKFVEETVRTKADLEFEAQLKSGQRPNFGLAFNSNNIFAVEPPQELWGEPDSRKYTIQELKSSITNEDMDFETLKQSWNLYSIDNGISLKMRLSVVSVSKTNKFDNRGMPIYTIESNIDVKPEFPDHIRELLERRKKQD